MKAKFSILVFVLVLMYVTTFSQDIKVMTFNIRLHTKSDSLNAWPYRKDLVASQVLYYHVNVLGVQEALQDQMEDLQKRLPQYKSIGVARDDGKKEGEYSALFYDTTAVTVLHSNTFWLSETPAVIGKKGWDAVCARIVTWGHFKEKKSGKLFYAFNTHFDHMGQVARRESAKLLLQKVNEIAGNTPAVITGDFNATLNDEPIKIILDKENPLRFIDAKTIAQHPHYGPTGTFTGFRNKEVDDLPIDFIFLRGLWKVKDHATISETWKGKFASDHFAVLATLQLP